MHITTILKESGPYNFLYKLRNFCNSTAVIVVRIIYIADENCCFFLTCISFWPNLLSCLWVVRCYRFIVNSFFFSFFSILGHGRSVAVMCALLVALGKAEDWKNAERLIRERRPYIHMNALQHEALEEWSKNQVSSPLKIGEMD